MIKETTSEKVLEILDGQIHTKFSQHMRGIQSAYNELQVLQDFRRAAFGEIIALDFKSKRPEGSSTLRF